MAETIRTAVESLELLLQYEKNLRRIADKIHSSQLDDILISLCEDVQKLLSCQRVTIYAKDPAKNEIFSKVKHGQEIREIRVPVTNDSIAGWVAANRRSIRVGDVYDRAELARIDPALKFDSSWDQKTGFRTRQMMAAPIQRDGKLYGVAQVINRVGAKSFDQADLANLENLAGTLAVAFQNQYRSSLRTSRYDALLLAQTIEPQDIDRAQAYAQKNRCSIDWALMEEGNIPRESVERSLSEFFGCPFVPYDEKRPAPSDLLAGWTIDRLKHHMFVPLETRDGRVVVIMENPKNVILRDDLQRRYPQGVSVTVSFREDLLRYIDRFLGSDSRPERKEFTDIYKRLEAEERPSSEEAPQETAEAREDDSGIVLLVNQIIEEAFAKGASDIHIEPSPDDDSRVRLRIDGVCRELSSVPRKFVRAVIQRIKIMAGLDIAERRLPQDGKIRFKQFGSRDIELRVATIPTAGDMEDVVMRLLASSRAIPLEELGMHPSNLEKFRKAIEEPYGIILCVGPTGSGKTTTLHSALGAINSPDLKIWTAEDPVEITQKGLRQVQVRPKIGFTFERALRAFLRGDPDVIMIGEMRDAETASAAIEASLTGHLVLSTLHTNSAPETITRLLDLGMDPYAFGDSILAVLAQRLVRRVCRDCAERYHPDSKEWAELRSEYGDLESFDALELAPKKATLMRGKGCERCSGTGYKGRMGIHELLVVDEDARRLIYRKAQSSEIREHAVRRGMILLKQDGIIKSLQGHTDLKEVRLACVK